MRVADRLSRGLADGPGLLESDDGRLVKALTDAGLAAVVRVHHHLLVTDGYWKGGRRRRGGGVG